MILVDSSVWIDYFRGGNDSIPLISLIENDLVFTNEIILAELIPNLIHNKQIEIADSLKSFECRTLDIDWQKIINFQTYNKQNGLNKVGIPDLIIAQQCINENYILWSLDKHFKIMAQFANLKLF